MRNMNYSNVMKKPLSMSCIITMKEDGKIILSDKVTNSSKSSLINMLNIMISMTRKNRNSSRNVKTIITPLISPHLTSSN